MAPPKSPSATSQPSSQPERRSTFRGWQPGVTEFFDGLEMDNTKRYWTDHKAFYLSDVLGPMQALVAELAPEFGEGRIFRPYRDTRFTSDKSPYKTNIAAHIDAGYLATNDSLRDYVQERLSGVQRAPDGRLIGPPGPRWNGKGKPHRADRRWVKAWSPEQISKRLQVDFPNDESMRISHEAIYQALFVQGRGALKR